MAPDCVPDPHGFWRMGPHKYGRYLHILTPAGSNDSHDGPQPWEGITGRVKQETNRLLGVIEKTDTAMQSRVDANKETFYPQSRMLEQPAMRRVLRACCRLLPCPCLCLLTCACP